MAEVKNPVWSSQEAMGEDRAEVQPLASYKAFLLCLKPS